jgi:hypothetical protein
MCVFQHPLTVIWNSRPNVSGRYQELAGWRRFVAAVDLVMVASE